MNPAFRKDIARSIRSSLGRFIAIAGIVALGCGFFAGLRMTGPDMRLSADAFFDETNLYDIRMISTLGYSQKQIDQIALVEGIEATEASKTADVMATLNGDQYAMRVSSFNVRDKEESKLLNDLVLEKGAWPKDGTECVLSADRVMGTPIKIGDTVQILYGTQDLDGVLAVKEFTVSGLAHSSSYVSSISLGSTSLGSGSIEQFVYVTEDAFDKDFPYTEVFATVKGAKDLVSGSDEYKACVSAVTARLEDMTDDLADGRYEELKQEAQEKVDDAQSELDEKKTDAYQKLDDGKAELDEASEKISSGWAQYYEGQQKVEDGIAQLESSKADASKQFEEAHAQLSSSQGEVDAGREAVAAGQLELDAQRQEYEAQLGAAQAALSEWETNYSAATTTLADLNATADGIRAQLEVLDPESEEYAALSAQLQEVEGGIAVAQGAVDQLNAAKPEIDSAFDQLAGWEAQLNSAQDQIDAQVVQLDEAQGEIDSGLQELEAKEQQAEEGFSSAQGEIDAASGKLSQSLIDLESGEQEYLSGLAEYQSSKDEADQKFADAQQEIDDAQSEVDEIEKPDIYVLDRESNYGVVSFESDSERIDNIARVFPFLFFLVAALVALTTMTRMVEEERILIGTYKALGYGRATIVSKYLIYGFVASFVGALLGVAILSQVLPFTVQKAYSIIYNVPSLQLPLPINIPIAVQSILLGVGVTVFATVAAVFSTLREQAAALMLPKAPKAGRRILLERIPIIWNRLSFSWKVTFRNLLRYKKRFWMTIAGIAGCTALLLTGLGLHDAIWDIIDKQYGPVVEYNIVVGMKDDVTQDQIDKVCSEMEVGGEATHLVLAQRRNMQVSSPAHSTMDISICVPQDRDELAKIITFKDRKSQYGISFGANDVIVTEKMANMLDVGPGDSITMFEQDDIGNAIGKGHEVIVSAVCEYYVGHAIFMGEDAWKTISDEAPKTNSIFGICTDDMAVRSKLAADLREFDSVETVMFNDETIDSYRKMLSSVNMIVVVLVVAAAVLAFIVLYNLTNINITERRREIASLKVLGFTKREVSSYIFREIAILTLIGAAIGLALGIVMESFVVVTAEVDYVMFGREIHMLSFAASYVLTFVFSAIVMLFMRGKLSEVDMVESLKSVD